DGAVRLPAARPLADAVAAAGVGAAVLPGVRRTAEARPPPQAAPFPVETGPRRGAAGQAHPQPAVMAHAHLFNGGCRRLVLMLGSCQGRWAACPVGGVPLAARVRAPREPVPWPVSGGIRFMARMTRPPASRRFPGNTMSEGNIA